MNIFPQMRQMVVARQLQYIRQHHKIGGIRMQVSQGNLPYPDAGIGLEQIGATIYRVHGLPIGFIAGINCLKRQIGRF